MRSAAARAGRAARRRKRHRGRRCESGSAVTLLAVLMAPVTAFAAIAATAVPQRLAAEAAAEASASSLATLAVAWRDAQGIDHGRVGWFFPDCAPLPPSAADGPPEAVGSELRRACEALTVSLLAGLGHRGATEATIAGFYSSAYAPAADADAGNGGHPSSLPCRAGSRSVAVDAVHLGLVAEWGTSRWAAAQAWPSGVTVGAEAVGAISRPAAGDQSASAKLSACGSLLRLDSHLGLSSPARSLAESLPNRAAFGN